MGEQHKYAEERIRFVFICHGQLTDLSSRVYSWYMTSRHLVSFHAISASTFVGGFWYGTSRAVALFV